MDGFVLERAETPRAEDVQLLEERIHAYNIARTGIPFGGPVAFFVRDTAGGIAAGVYGFVWGGCLQIETLWVHEELRGRGFGTALLRAAEAEGKARGCRQVLLSTHDFQAPGFYQRHGYETVGVAEDYPVGGRQYHLRKRLE